MLRGEMEEVKRPAVIGNQTHAGHLASAASATTTGKPPAHNSLYVHWQVVLTCLSHTSGSCSHSICASLSGENLC